MQKTMHHFSHEETGTGFLYNSDLSGNVEICLKNGETLDVPGSALVAFVAEHLRRERIARIEDMTVQQLLDDCLTR